MAAAQMNEQVYRIHENGGRYVRVVVKDATADVVRNVDGSTFTVPCQQAWVGHDDTQPASPPGSSMLIDMGHGRYLYAGSNVYCFSPKHAILAFYSNMGNSDVPYPVALDADYAYMMLDRVRVPRDKFPDNVRWADAYRHFYAMQKEQPGQPFDALVCIGPAGELVNGPPPEAL